MYCYEKPRTEDKTHTRKSFSLSTKTTPAAVSYQSLPDVAQRRFVGWDSEELTDSPQSKTGSPEYSMNDIRIPYSPSEPSPSGIHVNGSSRLGRDAIDTEEKGSGLSGTVQLCAKPKTGQPCVQFKLDEYLEDKVVGKLEKAKDRGEDFVQDPVRLGRIIIRWLEEAKCNSWEWEDVVTIALRCDLVVTPEKQNVEDDLPGIPLVKDMDIYDPQIQTSLQRVQHELGLKGDDANWALSPDDLSIVQCDKGIELYHQTRKGKDVGIKNKAQSGGQGGKLVTYFYVQRAGVFYLVAYGIHDKFKAKTYKILQAIPKYSGLDNATVYYS